MSEHTVRRLHILGWGLFVASAVLFMAAAWRSGDAVAFLAAVVFLVGCVVFLLPLVRRS